MKIRLGKLAPSALVLAFAGYSAWPYIDPPSAAPESKADAASILAALAAPPSTKTGTRDPFYLAADAAEIARAARRGAPARGARTAESAEGGSASFLASLSKLVAMGETYAAKARREQQEIRSALTGAYRLSAISIVNGRRVAILNDRSYVQGSAVDPPKPLPAPVVLAEVLPDRARLRCLGVRVDVGFPDLTTPSAAPASGAKAGIDLSDLGERPPAKAGRPGAKRRTGSGRNRRP